MSARRVFLCGLAFLGMCGSGYHGEAAAETIEIHPASTDSCDENFQSVANKLQPGDELVLHDGVYSQGCRRGISVNGKPGKPIVIRVAAGAHPVIARSPQSNATQNNIDIIDSNYLTIRGLHFRGGSTGVKIARGSHLTLEDNEIFETQNNAIAINSGDADSLIIRRNHIHHTGLYPFGPTEGEGMYIGCHEGTCKVTNSLFEGNYIHHLRGTSAGGNDGIEIKVGSYNNVVRDNVIHDTNIGSKYPCIFVYGGGPERNLVEGNAVWNCGEAIQVVADAIIRNNLVLNSAVAGIVAGPHAVNRRVRNVTIVNNTIVGHPTCLELHWNGAENMVLANNAVYCPDGTAMNAAELEGKNIVLRANFLEGKLIGVRLDGESFLPGGSLASAFFSSDVLDVWPRPESALIGKGDATLAPRGDFNDIPRGTKTVDVGAYETRSLNANPGWKVTPGFKQPSVKRD
jgi:Right handed beta helix region